MEWSGVWLLADLGRAVVDMDLITLTDFTWHNCSLWESLNLSQYCNSSLKKQGGKGVEAGSLDFFEWSSYDTRNDPIELLVFRNIDPR